MQTTCPECRTTFRVSQDHLGARRGMVRCGHCNAVFNAYDTLLPELEAPSADELSESPPHVAEPNLSEVLHTAEAQPAANFPAADTPAATENIALESIESVFARPDKPDALSLDIPKNILLEPLWPKAPKRVWSWQLGVYSVLSILLLGLLALQVSYFLRAEWVAAMPELRPALEAMCRPLNCDVPLPHQLTQESIISSTLEQDPEQKSRIRLTFLLANRTGQAQTWPLIALTLSDVREAPVAQQVFPPKIYLPKEIKIPTGMAAGSEQEIRLDLDIGNLVASGYTLSLTYP